MKTVYKFPIPHSRGAHHLALPADTQVLAFAMQHGNLCMWVLLDTGARTVEWEFRVVYTGDAVLESFGQHFGTAQMMSGEIIVHLFGRPV